MAEHYYSNERKKKFWEHRFLIAGAITGTTVGVLVVTLTLLGIVLLPVSFGGSSILITVAMFIGGTAGTFDAIFKYLGRGLDPLRNEKKNKNNLNQKLGALIGFILGIGLAIAILFCPFLNFIPLGFLGLMIGISPVVLIILTLISVPGITASAADKIGQLIDCFTNNSIIDAFLFLYEGIKNSLGIKTNSNAAKATTKNIQDGSTETETAKKKGLWNNELRGLALGVGGGGVLAIALIVFFPSVLAFTGLPLIPFIISAALFIWLFAVAFSTLPKYMGRAIDLLTSGVATTNQRLAALVGCVVGFGLFIASLCGFHGLFRPNLNGWLKMDEISKPFQIILEFFTIATVSSWFDKFGQTVDASQESLEENEKITILNLLVWVKNKVEGDDEFGYSSLSSAWDSQTYSQVNNQISHKANGHTLIRSGEIDESLNPPKPYAKEHTIAQLLCRFIPCFRDSSTDDHLSSSASYSPQP